jgi:hypothetical protein
LALVVHSESKSLETIPKMQKEYRGVNRSERIKSVPVQFSSYLEDSR